MKSLNLLRTLGKELNRSNSKLIKGGYVPDGCDFTDGPYLVREGHRCSYCYVPGDPGNTYLICEPTHD